MPPHGYGPVSMATGLVPWLRALIHGYGPGSIQEFEANYILIHFLVIEALVLLLEPRS